MKRSCQKGFAILLVLCMTLALLPGVMPHAKANGVTTRTTILDLSTGSVTYAKSSGTASVDPSNEDITDSVEGWSWNHTTKTLVLNGINLETDAELAALLLPADSTIVLADGSVNTVQSTYDGDSGIFGIYCQGALTVQGDTGRLNVVGGASVGTSSTAVFVDDSLTISGGNLNVRGGQASINSMGLYASGALTISGGSVEASTGAALNSYGIRARSTITVSGGNVEAKGNTGTSGSYGIDAYGVITFTGGTIYASSTSSADSEAYAVHSSGGITDNGMNALQKSGADYTMAATKTHIESVYEYYTYLYNSDEVATDIRISPSGGTPGGGTPGVVASATVSDKTVSGKTNIGAIDDTIRITLTGCTFTGSVSTATVYWITNLPNGLVTKVNKVDTDSVPGSTIIGLRITGTAYAASHDAMSITIPADLLSTGSSLTVTVNSNTRFDISHTRLFILDLTGTSVYFYNENGSYVSADPTASNIINTVEGWSWYHAAGGGYTANTLLLNGIDLETSISNIAIRLPANSTIVLAEGSNNIVASTYSSTTRVGVDCIGISSAGALTVQGAGTLSVQSGNTADNFSIGIYAKTNLTISGGTINTTGGRASQSSFGLYSLGNTTINGGIITASGASDVPTSNSYGLIGGGNTFITGGTVTASGGSNALYSMGLSSYGGISITGGTVTAAGSSGIEGSYGIASFSGSTTISGGEITALAGSDSPYSIGLYGNGDISITGGIVTAEGRDATEESNGIISNNGNATFSGGTIYAKSGGSPESYAVYAGLGITDTLRSVLQKDEDSNYKLTAAKAQLEEQMEEGEGSYPYYTYLYNRDEVASDIMISPMSVSFSGTGTEQDPYLIASAAQLKEMSDRVNNQNDLFGNKHYKLTADIVLNADIHNDPEQWSPIGTGFDAPFSGDLDGNAHTINGLYIDSSDRYLGLFGFIEHGTVKNLGLIGGEIVSNSPSAKVGGIAGFISSGTIEDCYNTGTVTGTFSFAGGIVGINANSHIQDCYNTGAISGSGNGGAVGGIAGQNMNAEFTIVNCYNTGSVTFVNANAAYGAYVGGIAGQNLNASIKNSYSTGALSGGSPDHPNVYVGGIAGSSELGSGDTIENAYWLQGTADYGIAETAENTGTTSMTDSEMKAEAFVASLNSNVDALKNTYRNLSPWKADSNSENGGYPVFGMQPASFTLTLTDGGTGATGGGSYLAGIAVSISAGTKTGYTFSGWTANSGSFADASLANTTFTMPGTNVTITAHWTLINPSPGNTGGTGGTGNSNEVYVLVNGKQESAGTSKTETGIDGKTVTTVTVDSEKLETILASKNSGAIVTILITNGANKAVGALTGQMIKSMENKAATLVIKTGSSSYTLPASEINIDAVSQQLGANVALADIAVSVSISAPSDTMAKVVENAGKDGGFTIVAPAVDFTITCTYGEKTVNVSLFNTYVERMLAIPDGIDPTKITTGIIVKPDGTVYHVPTRVTKIDGKYFAVINSLTNSTYSVIWNPVEFSDVANHWAKDAVNNMGSRMIISGTGNGNFDPDRTITRAEFATIVVKALGLEPGIGSSSFRDVDASEWYFGYIKTAASYGIIKGYTKDTFGPNDTITREQAMVMITKAMKLTGLNAQLTGNDIGKLIGTYTDGADVSAYAKDSVAACLKTSIVYGRDGNSLAPKAKVTRAEAATMIEKLLHKSNLI